MRARLGRWSRLSGSLLACAVCVTLAGRVSSAQAAPSAAQQLVDKYAPVVMMRAQENGICDSSEEQFWPPSPVSIVLGNPRVRLLERLRGRMRLIKRAPTAADLARKGGNYYVDLPGDPLDPGCTYAQALAAIRRAGRAPAVTYAHLAYQAGFQELALQYWFYYYFNQFNDLHESDWEGMQIAFDGTTPAQALSEDPYEILLFQHAGGEHADWDDARVQLQGSHPVVYSAAGSHATFYSSALWLGNGQNGSGVGCDNTTRPLIATHPRPILLPNAPPTTGRFAWLSFRGHWGQREAGFNNGPTGPNTKTVWRTPFTFMDGTRADSPRVPGGTLFGPSTSGVFCGAVAQVSQFINLAAKTRAGAIAIVAGLILLVLIPASATRWRPVALEPLRRPRTVGQLLLVTDRLCRHHVVGLVAVAASCLVLVAACEALEVLVRHALGLSASRLSFVDAGGAIGISSSVSIGREVATLISDAAAVSSMREIERTGKVAYLALWKAVARRLWRLIVAPLLATFGVLLLFVTVIGIPFAFRKFVDWSFLQQEILFEDRSLRQSFTASKRVVTGHRWRILLIVVVLWLISQVPTVLLGAALLLTSIRPNALELLGSVVFMLIVPYVGAARTLLYLDLAERKATGVEPTREPSPLRRLVTAPMRAVRPALDQSARAS